MAQLRKKKAIETYTNLMCQQKPQSLAPCAILNFTQQHLTKTIEVTRVNLFNIINQYKAIFPEEDILASDTLTSAAASQKPLQGVTCDGSRLFQSWLHEKICEFLKTLEFDLQRGVVLFDTVLGQCMYFGLSFSRVGADFRALMVPIFVRVIKDKFLKAMAVVNQNFAKELEKYTLINKVTVHHTNTVSTSSENDVDTYSPPETLLDFHPLAALCNGYLNALNDLRLCAPTALTNDVTNSLQQSLEMVAKKILAFYRQEQQAFTANEKDTFSKFCSCFAYDLTPYLQRCIHAIFSPNILSSHLGVNINDLESTKISYLQQEAIFEPLKHLLPPKIETHIRTEMPKSLDKNSSIED